MPDSLAALKADRSKLLVLSLGDFRPGSVTAVVRRCGKQPCDCAPGPTTPAMTPNSG